MESVAVTNRWEKRWCLFPWFPEHGAEMIHPEDINAMTNFQPYGMVFECVGQDDTFVTLAYGDQLFRVKPNLIRIVDAPKKRIGDVVKVESGSRVVTAIVVEIQWHHKRSEPFYLVAKDGKRSSRRYWDSEFLPDLGQGDSSDE